VALAQAGIPFVVLDNFCNSRRSVLQRVERITGAAVPFIEGDVRDVALLQRVFAEHQVDAVIHFAALKAVGESVREPLRYYDNNVAGTVALLSAMQTAGVRTLVFSSSATVYGDPVSVPIRETFALSATNPYGFSKLMMEQVLADVDAAQPGQWRIARLRYFNPVGAHQRLDWRRPAGHSQQPAALRGPGGGGAA
jgi:UDP-glucose 4-epimerase